MGSNMGSKVGGKTNPPTPPSPTPPTPTGPKTPSPVGSPPPNNGDIGGSDKTGGIAGFTRDQIEKASPDIQAQLLLLQQKIEDRFKNHQTSEAQFRAEEAALLKQFSDVEIPD